MEKRINEKCEFIYSQISNDDSEWKSLCDSPVCNFYIDCTKYRVYVEGMPKHMKENPGHEATAVQCI
jgi:hypothetical protein